MFYTYATQLLRDDHKKVRGLFAQLQSIDERAPEMKPGVVNEVLMELEIHSELEERIFYPSFLNCMEMKENLKGQALIEESFKDHSELKQMIATLRKMSVHDERFNLSFEVLIKAVTDHVEVEEIEILPVAEQAMSNRLGELGMQMEKLRTELKADPKYRESLVNVVQDLRGGEQKRKTAA